MPRPSRLLAVLVLLLALAAPTAAVAQSDNPFTPLPQAQQDDGTQTQTIPETADNSTADDGGLSRAQEILIFLAGVLLIAGIAWVILRDARRRAPVSDAELRHRGEDTQRGTRPDAARRKAQNRSRAKAQRRARRRNR